MTEENKSVKNFPNYGNVPKLRFPEFDDEWEERFISEVISSKSKKYNPENNDSNYPSIELESLSQDSGELLSTFDSKNQKSIKNVFNSGDILFGKLRPYLKKYYLADFDGVCSSEIWVLKSSILDSNYLYAFVQSNSFISLTEISSGSKMPRADWNLVSSSSIIYPSNPDERKKIGQLIQLINSRIQTQRKIIKDLVILKSNTAQNIFNQVFRFKDSEDSEFPKWDIKKLGDVCEIKRGASPRPISDSKWFEENSQIGWVRISDVTKSNKYLEKTEQYLSKAGIAKSRLVKKGNMIMSICATIGKPIYTNLDVCIHDGFVVFENLTLDKEFLYYYLDFIQLNWYKYGQPGIQVNLNSEIVNNESVVVPIIEEQIKIAEFLSKFDKKIKLENKLLSQYENQKKYLLQQMFI